MVPNAVTAKTEYQLMFQAARHELLREFLFNVFAPHVKKSRTTLQGAPECDSYQKLAIGFASYETAVLAFLKPYDDSDLGAVDIYCSVLRKCINQLKLNVQLLVDPSYRSPDLDADPPALFAWYRLRDDIIGGVKNLTPWPVDFVRDRLREDILDPIKELTYLWFMFVQQGLPRDFRGYLSATLRVLLDRKEGTPSQLTDDYMAPNWVIAEVDRLSGSIDKTVEQRLQYGSAMQGLRESIRSRVELWEPRLRKAEASAAVHEHEPEGQESSRTARCACSEFDRFVAPLWTSGKSRTGRVSNLHDIAIKIDSVGFGYPSDYLEHKAATALKEFNSKNSKTKSGPIKYAAELVTRAKTQPTSLGPILRGLQKRLSRAESKVGKCPVHGSGQKKSS